MEHYLYVLKNILSFWACFFSLQLQWSFLCHRRPVIEFMGDIFSEVLQIFNYLIYHLIGLIYIRQAIHLNNKVFVKHRVLNYVVINGIFIQEKVLKTVSSYYLPIHWTLVLGLPPINSHDLWGRRSFEITLQSKSVSPLAQWLWSPNFPGW